MYFKKTFSYKLDLKNPKTLNEKLQWKKIYDRKDIYTLCSDKYKVRDYIDERIGAQYLIPLILATDNPKKIKYEELPDSFIMKYNHNSGHNIIVRKKGYAQIEKIRLEGRRWLKRNYYQTSKEWQYKNIKPLIIVEKLLVDENGNVPLDYKFHCFHEKVEAIQVDIDRFENHKRNFYDTNWKLLPFIWCTFKNAKPLWGNGRDIDRPILLKEMIDVAEKLSKGFDYVRVDLYSFENKVYFGEMTFTHGGGYEMFYPAEYDKIFGEKLKLNRLKHRFA